MRRTILLITVVLSVAFVFALFLIGWSFEQRFSLVKSIYQLKVEELAKAISLGYFQWNHMYQTVSQNDTEEIERQFYQIKEDFPQVKEIRLVEQESFDFPTYRVSSQGTELILTFKIFNDDLSRFIENKVALAVVDAQQILSSLEIKEIKISEKGRDFVFDLKAQRVRLSLVDLLILLFCIVGAFFSYFGAVLVRTKTKLKVEKQMRKKSEREHKVTQILLEMIVSFLENKLQNEYEYCLKKAIEVVPGSQGGSVLVRDSERYVYVAAVGFDLQKLREISFSSEEISEWTGKTFCVRTNVKEYNEMNMPPEKLEVLRRFARINEIKSTLIIPVKLKEEIVLLLNLDNFEREDAFTDESVELAKLFANYLGIVVQRKILEKQILQQGELMEYLSY
ncbi:MAG: GAF domain-containing protein, partial [Pseudothermotoga sp.]